MNYCFRKCWTQKFRCFENESIEKITPKTQGRHTNFQLEISGKKSELRIWGPKLRLPPKTPEIPK